jgi:hypothetical protein
MTKKRLCEARHPPCVSCCLCLIPVVPSCSSCASPLLFSGTSPTGLKTSRALLHDWPLLVPQLVGLCITSFFHFNVTKYLRKKKQFKGEGVILAHNSMVHYSREVRAPGAGRGWVTLHVQSGSLEQMSPQLDFSSQFSLGFQTTGWSRLHSG